MRFLCVENVQGGEMVIFRFFSNFFNYFITELQHDNAKSR